MKLTLYIIILFALLVSCSEENPVDPNIYDLDAEVVNMPWESISGKIAYYRYGTGVILIDCDNRKIKILKNLPGLNIITWHYSGTKITGVDLGWEAILDGGKAPTFYCIDLNGNYSSSEYSPAALHSWSNNGKIASVRVGGGFLSEYSSTLYIDEQKFLSYSDSSSDYFFLETRPAWSAANNYIVTAIRGVSGGVTHAELKKFDINSKIGTTLVVANSIGYDTSYAFEDPIYSPDGNRIAYVYVTSHWESGIGTTYVKEIMIVDSDGSNKLRLTTGYNDTFPAWSPDGLKIIFRRNSIDPGVSDGIFMINVDGTGLQKILSKGSVMPIWN